MKTVQVDRCQNVGNFGCGDVEFGEKLDLSARDRSVHVQFPRDRDEIFLKHLQRHDSSSGSPVLGY